MSKTKKQQSNKFLARLVAVVLALAILAAGICCLGYASRNEANAWFKNGNIATWHWKDKPTTPDESKKPEESSFLVRAQYNAGDLATFAATPYVDDGNSVYLTLLTDPVETDDTFSWSSSDTSCVTVTPADNGRSATVTCLQAFEEQITVKAVSNETGLEAVATCDYVKRVQAISLTVTPDTVKLSPSSSEYTVEAVATFGIGTITPEIILNNGKFTISPYSYGGGDFIQASGYFDEDNGEGQIYSSQIDPLKFTGNTFTVSDASGLMSFGIVDSNYNNQAAQYRVEAAQKLNNEIKRYYDRGMKTAKVSTDYTVTYGGKEYSAGALEATVSLDISGLMIYANTITPSRPEIIF